MQSTGIVRQADMSPISKETVISIPSHLLKAIGVDSSGAVEIFITDDHNLGIQKYYGDCDNEATSHLELRQFILPEYIHNDIREEERARATKEFESKLCSSREYYAKETEQLMSGVKTLEDTIKKLKGRIKALKSVLIEVLKDEED